MEAAPAVTKEMYNRICAQYEFLQGKSVFEAYRNHYEALGDNAMNYKEFDFWYNRFENEEMDLNHDRSKDPKTRGFSDLSMETVDKIVQKLQWKERSIFRDVSEKCRESVDKYTITIDNVELTDIDIGRLLKIDNHSIQFESKLKSDNIRKIENGEKSTIKTTTHFDRLVLDELVLLLKIPNLKIKKLFLFIEHLYYWFKFGKFLKSLKRQIHVESFQLEFYDENIENKAIRILPFLKPGVLKSLRFGCYEGVHDFVPGTIVGKVMKLEQWKQAKRLTTNVTITVQINDIKHFDYLNIMMDSKIEIKADDVIRLKETFSNSPTFESCFLRASFNEQAVRDKLENSTSDGDKIRVELSSQWGQTNSSLKFSIQ